MNRHVLRDEMATSEALNPSTEWARNAAAFFSLALEQRRDSWMHRRMAVELPGLLPHLDDGHFEHNRQEARRLWRAAKENLSYARHHRDMGANRGA
jgi:hypothetical protein